MAAFCYTLIDKMSSDDINWLEHSVDKIGKEVLMIDKKQSLTVFRVLSCLLQPILSSVVLVAESWCIKLSTVLRVKLKS